MARLARKHVDCGWYRRVAAAAPARSTHSAHSGGTTAPPPSEYFIDRVKRMGANALLGAFHASGTRFDSTLEGLTITAVGTGTVSAAMPVTLAVSNAWGTLHGGATATIVDIVGTMALLTLDPARPGVSVDLNVSYLAPAKVGEHLRIEAKTWRAGKKLGFCQVDIYRGSDGAPVATGRHTKAL